VKKGFVEITDCHDQDRYQVKAYDECYRKHGKEYAWIGFLDFDEFLRWEGKKKISSMFAGYDADCVLVNWRLMTDNGLVHYDPRPLAERFTVAMEKDKPVKYSWPENKHIKSFIRGGLHDFKFESPHVAKTPLRCINPSGKPVKQQAFTEIDWSVMRLDHYWTKTAEEWVNVKLSRGYHGDEHYTNMIKSQSDRNFFGVNERTPEKEMILSALLFSNPKTEKIMNHIAKTPQGNDQYRLEAETGYLLKSKLSGKTYKTIDTRDLKRWEAVEDPDFVKQEVKTEESLGKPKTTKRTNRKGK
jgi:hypothetical protein